MRAAARPTAAIGGTPSTVGSAERSAIGHRPPGPRSGAGRSRGSGFPGFFAGRRAALVDAAGSSAFAGRPPVRALADLPEAPDRGREAPPRPGSAGGRRRGVRSPAGSVIPSR
ncbi:hypothetical protein GCM10023320_37940 [Pseudonocardia adelaidensis]|uniref:Uncharacterized protein n=1 Tax=Pseudonocardia adelaidensis TaxID=648754 RepID=A0ABP9NKI9_9PSEU